MKNNFFGGILLLGISFMFMACPADDDNNMNTDDTSEVLEQLAEGSGWEVTYFFDNDSDETNDFNGYTFIFNDNGTLVTTNGTMTHEGTWSISDDSNSSDNDDDSSSDDVDFNIFFNVSQDSDFEDLNDDWDVILINSNKIEIIDVSGGNGETDYLTFER